MKHFSLEEWLDFARKRAPSESIAEMQRHLAESCTECARIVATWNAALDVASREKRFQAPESGVRCAKALFNIAPPEKAAGLDLHVARLVFSSFGQPAMEGARGAGASSCHLLFEGSNWLLDLHMKPEAERDHVSVAGQILDRAQSEKGYRGRCVTVLRQRTELARTTTNEFGEFHMEFSPGEDLMLTVDLEGKSVLISALPLSVTRGEAS
jgi:hypothetical protein